MGSGRESENGIGGQGVALTVERKCERWTESLIVVFEGDVSAGEAVVRIAGDIGARKDSRTVGAGGKRLGIAVGIYGDDGYRDGAGVGRNGNGDGTGVTGTEDAVAGIMRGDVVASAGQHVGCGIDGSCSEWERGDAG